MVVYMNGDICITDDYEILENEYVELKYSGYSKTTTNKMPISAIILSISLNSSIFIQSPLQCSINSSKE